MDYLKIYNTIIKKAIEQNRNPKDRYYEKHHIIPKCIGGNNTKENLIFLTPREHFLCHRLLCLIYPTELKLKFALWYMSNNNKYFISSRTYEHIRNELSNALTGKNIEELYGTEKANEMKEKMSLARKNVPWEIYFGEERAKELKKKLIERRTGAKHSKETINKMKNSSKNEEVIKKKREGLLKFRNDKFNLIKEENLNNAKNLYMEGKSIFFISRNLGITRFMVRKILDL